MKMFDLPDAKRIRRSDFNRSRSSSPCSDTSSSEANAALLQAKLAAIYGPIEYDTPLQSTEVRKDVRQEVEIRNVELGKNKKGEREGGRDGAMDVDSDSSDPEDEDDDVNVPISRALSSTPSEHEYEFSLFRPSSTTTQSQSHAHTQTIILSSSPGPREGRLLASRPLSHFIARKAEGRRRAELEYAAMSGETVLQGREKRAWGLEVRWRVRVLRDGVLYPNATPVRRAEETQKPSLGKENTDPPTILGQQDGGGKGESKHKPNKKRRIFLRTQAREREAAEEARKKARAGKEEAEKEKRTRLNRAKKVKRRLKEKARKAEGGGGGGDGDGAVAGGDRVEEGEGKEVEGDGDVDVDME